MQPLRWGGVLARRAGDETVPGPRTKAGADPLDRAGGRLPRHDAGGAVVLGRRLSACYQALKYVATVAGAPEGKEWPRTGVGA